MRLKIYLSAFLVCFLCICQCEKESVMPPGQVNIPDRFFLQALVCQGVDTNEDGKVSKAEAEAVISLRLGNCIPEGKIESLEGIEAFVNLEILYCCCNKLSSLDLSHNLALTSLSCCENELRSLDLSKNLALTNLSCSENKLSILDVSNNTALTDLRCNKNNLTSLDLSQNVALTELSCRENRLTSLDLSQNVALTELSCRENRLTSLDLSGAQNLINLQCGYNELSSLDISNNLLLVDLNVSFMPSLGMVCVWAIPFPPPGVTVFTTESPNVTFTDECSR